MIKLFITKSGESQNQKIDLNDLPGQQKEILYNLTYEIVSGNFNSPDHKLYKSEHENLYWFNSSKAPGWDETPFSVDPELFKDLKKYSSVIATTLLEMPQKSESRINQRPAVSKLNNKKTEKKQIRVQPTESENHPAPTKIFTKTPDLQPEIKPLSFNPKISKPLEFTYLTKKVFRDPVITKLDLLEYYDNIFPVIFPYLKERPIYFRWHRGSIRESIYNKSLQSLTRDWKGNIPDWVSRIPIFSESYKENRDYLVCKNKEHLLFLIEVGCVELSPWHSLSTSINFPDYFVIDLDPVETTYELLAETALTAREVLKAAGLPSFLKTSGSRGLHIYVPLENADYNVSRELSEIVCRLIHLKSPGLTSLERLPENRKGKVYLDFLQNAKGKSIAAPYCVRPVESAGVSTPIEWDELTKSFSLQDYNFFTIRKRINEKGDLFAGLSEQRVDGPVKLNYLNEVYGFLLK